MSREIRYGRGKHVAHPKYIEYMEATVADPAYAGMPDAVKDGRVFWQVSSGKTTSFYASYEARKKWWIAQADRLKIPGSGELPKGRLSITARVLHPTKRRVCRLCGESFHVGYMYLGATLAKRWNKLTKSTLFSAGQDVRAASVLLESKIGRQKTLFEIETIFPERRHYFNSLPDYEKFFARTYAMRSGRISPGFMSNPPDRLDGFHDYCYPNGCRANKDPGRSMENMRSYSVDRRVFEWWSEGDWVVAQALFNSAGAGRCGEPNCGKHLKKVSPDHVGPLACGFKQISFFIPLCNHHQSAKNRRLSVADVQRLKAYEALHQESVASWQVAALWDHAKNLVRTDRDAVILSNVMRSVQDYYMRALYLMLQSGYAYELTWLLSPEQLAYNVTFFGLDRGTFTFQHFTKNKRNNNLSQKRAGRIIRVAFQSLVEYVIKEREDRKLVKLPAEAWLKRLTNVLDKYAPATDARARLWQVAMLRPERISDREINGLLTPEYYATRNRTNLPVIRALKRHFREVGAEAAMLFSRSMEDVALSNPRHAAIHE